MNMSAWGRKALMAREGVRLTAYRDSKGILTIGVGHTASCGAPFPEAGMTITAAECDAALARDLTRFEAAVRLAITRPMTQNQFDACVSLAFNIGSGAFANSTVVHRFNAGDIEGAANAILMWNHPPEIMGRRRTEYIQFGTPDSGATPASRPGPATPAHKPKPATATPGSGGSMPTPHASLPVATAAPAPGMWARTAAALAHAFLARPKGPSA